MIQFWHVEPTNDIKPHSTGHADAANCQCKPRTETQPNGNIVVVHNAWDGREFYEGDLPTWTDLKTWGRK